MIVTINNAIIKNPKIAAITLNGNTHPINDKIKTCVKTSNITFSAVF